MISVRIILKMIQILRQTFPLNPFTSVKEKVSKLMSDTNPKEKICSPEKEDIQLAETMVRRRQGVPGLPLDRGRSLTSPNYNWVALSRLFEASLSFPTKSWRCVWWIVFRIKTQERSIQLWERCKKRVGGHFLNKFKIHKDFKPLTNHYQKKVFF